MVAPSISPAVKTTIHANNKEYSEYVLIALAALVVTFIVHRVIICYIQWIRMLISANDSRQQIFRRPNPAYAWIKEHMIYSPLSFKRHSRQIRLGPADMGTLPTRFHSLLITGIIAMNTILCIYGIEWNGPLRLKLWHLRNRSGSLALVNMIPLVIMAGRNNPLIGVTHIPFDTFNLMHRWFGKIVVALAITHSTVEIIAVITGSTADKKVHPSGFTILRNFIREERFLTYGFVVSRFLHIATMWG